jgi:hypothetical protein
MNCDVGTDEMIRRAGKFRRRQIRVARSRKFEMRAQVCAGFNSASSPINSTVSRAFDRGSGV